MIDLIAAAILLVSPTAHPQDKPNGQDPATQKPETPQPAGGRPATPAQQQPQQQQPPANPPPAPPARPTPTPAPAQANPNQPNPPSQLPITTSGTTGQGGAKIPPIQDVGNEYILTFDETGGEDALTLEAFVKICQQTTGLNFTYGRRRSRRSSRRGCGCSGRSGSPSPTSTASSRS
jgi:hypothetical protein